jgi:DNA-binding HxlR family transcriptional regulator
MPVTTRKQTEGKDLAPRRSPCPVACSLDIFGDRWTLLIVRDLFLGRTRFKDFAASPEGIPTNILTDRLERLVTHRIIEQIPADDGTKRLAYRLTKKGKSLGPILKAIRDWGLNWDKTTRAMLSAKS